MTRPSRIRFPAWWTAVLLGAVGFLGWGVAARIGHVRYVSGLGGGSEAHATVAGGSRSSAGHDTIIPEHLARSFHWLLQTELMLERGEARVRHVDYENAPIGHAVRATSPYRWWLGLLAAGDHALSGRPTAESLERAALLADPLLHGLLLFGTALFVAWRFGAWSAALVSIGLVALYPFAADFVAGAPDDFGLARILALWSVLLLVAGLPGTSDADPARRSRWFAAAGVVGGLGLWISVPIQLSVVGGLCLGGLLAAWVLRTGPASPPLPWRTWAGAGAVTILAAYLVEFAPVHLGGWNLTSIHPLHGLAWLGGGELLAQATGWIQAGKRPRGWRDGGRIVGAAAAVAGAVLVAWRYQDRAALVPDPLFFRLAKLTEATDAATVLATVLPVTLLVAAGWLLVRRATGAGLRVGLAISLGPVLVALGFACRQLGWWNQVDALLLVGLAAAAGRSPDPARPRLISPAIAAVVALALLPGVFLLAPTVGATTTDKLSRSEVLALVERDLARWLAQRGPPGNVVVLAPPGETTALCYYGGLRGIGSLSAENKDGVAMAMRLLAAPTAQEAKELVDQRGITHVVLLSWDSYFDAYAQAATGKVEGTFRDSLKLSTLPLWLRPAPYQTPTIEGFEGQSVTVFEVVAEQTEATALNRIAAYLIETGNLDEALAVAQALRRYPTDLGAWVSRAEVALARGDEAELAAPLAMLKRRLGSKQPAALVWDQRARLAVMLARVKERSLAQEQVAVCFETADEEKLRGLSAGSLYRLLVLGRAFDLSLDPKLHALALDLLPGDLRARLM